MVSTVSTSTAKLTLLPWTKHLIPSSLSFPIYKMVIIMLAQTVKNLPTVWETQLQSLDREDALENGMEPTLIFLPRRIPWTEGPGGLQSTGSQKSWTRLSD